MATRTEPTKVLADMIALAQEYDRRGDAVLRNKTVSQILGDEIGLPLRTIRKALREAGLIKAK